jgi:hypothetical protein
MESANKNVECGYKLLVPREKYIEPGCKEQGVMSGDDYSIA